MTRFARMLSVFALAGALFAPGTAHAGTETDGERGHPLTLRASADPAPNLQGTFSSGPSRAVLVLVALGVVGVAIVLRRRTSKGSPLVVRPLAISARVAVGFRSELVVVEASGRRMLVGVTPNAIGLLSELDPSPGEEDVESAATEGDEPGRSTNAPSSSPRAAPSDAFEVRLRSLVDHGDDRARSRAPLRPASEPPVERQARELLRRKRPA
ncbi:MAG: flagellar biosynthetic protein FliO [Polyangiaceae bacterium]